MSIEGALFKYKGNVEEIDVKTIETRTDFEILKKNLYCTYDGCPAKIEYVPRGVYKAYFKTWPKQDHTADCIDYFDREKKRKSEEGSATINVTLSEKHIRNVLKTLYKEVNETKEAREKRLENQKTNKKKKNKTVDGSQPAETTVKMNATTERGETVGKGVREPNVRKKHNIQLLNEADIGFTRAIYGLIETIDISNGKVTMILYFNNKKCKVHFEEAFFATAARNILSMFQSVKTALLNGYELEFTGAGQVIKREQQIDLLILEQYAFSINNYPIAVFSFNYSNGV
ncbi:hypothetical protein [Neobacillus sp. FSL H8-0543]|uniref:hypothetical protein n=1 Tax=Neobacillus sp. FSL H8-0543 TaxID=2954672 RepID=UPI0031595EED